MKEKKMKKLLFLLLALALTPALRADEGAEALLARMKATIDGYASHRVDFRGGTAGEGFAGRLTVGGRCYALDMPDVEIRFDGSTLYTFDKAGREVILERPDPDNDSPLSDPSRIFDLSGANFTVVDRGATTHGGRALRRIELTPRAAGIFEHITLDIDPATALPTRMDYRITGMGAFTLEIDAITPNVPVDDSTFVFDPARHPGVEVIDFR